MSALKEQLGQWLSALKAFDDNHTVDALEQFMGMPDSARMFFNGYNKIITVGMCAMKLMDGEEAIAAFTDALKCDECNCYVICRLLTGALPARSMFLFQG
jgi:hypothetical protein